MSEKKRKGEDSKGKSPKSLKRAGTMDVTAQVVSTSLFLAITPLSHITTFSFSSMMYSVTRTSLGERVGK
jgi:hypothetical protein